MSILDDIGKNAADAADEYIAEQKAKLEEQKKDDKSATHPDTETTAD